MAGTVAYNYTDSRTNTSFGNVSIEAYAQRSIAKYLHGRMGLLPVAGNDEPVLYGELPNAGMYSNRPSDVAYSGVIGRQTVATIGQTLVAPALALAEELVPTTIAAPGRNAFMAALAGEMVSRAFDAVMAADMADAATRPHNVMHVMEMRIAAADIIEGALATPVINQNIDRSVLPDGPIENGERHITIEQVNVLLSKMDEISRGNTAGERANSGAHTGRDGAAITADALVLVGNAAAGSQAALSGAASKPRLR